MTAQPYPHPSGATPPALGPERSPAHVAVVMDGNGRWARERGEPRTEGHRAGEAALVEVVAGAVEAGVPWLTVYAFSTENWKRSPAEVRFLMGYSRTVLRRRRDLFDSWNVRVRWAGERRRLAPSVVKELDDAVQLTRDNTGLTLTLCVNYGGRAEIAAAVGEIAAAAARGAGERWDAERVARTVSRAITEESISAALATPAVDLFWRTSGEQRLSNFLIWQSAYAELVFTDKLWPDVDRRDLWEVIRRYAERDRRFGAA